MGEKMSGQVVIKISYNNAGQGVFMIIHDKEGKDVMNMDIDYERYIVQSPIGNYNWSSTSKNGKFCCNLGGQFEP